MPAQLDLDAVFDAAISAHETRRRDDARQLCRDILRADPDHADAMNLLGVILQDEGHAEDSIPLLTRATHLAPKFPDAFANLARGFRLIGEPGKAVVAARKATELDPDLGEGWLQFGFALATLGRHEEALPVLRNAVARTPENIDLFMGIGATAEALRDYSAAAEAWREALRLRPDRTDALIKLGIALTAMNQLDEALVPLRRALDRAPGDIDALEALARLLHRRFEGAELTEVCHQILAKHPERIDILGLLSNGQIWLGQFREVEKTREAVLALQPENRSFAQQVGAMIPGFIDHSDITLCRAQLEDLALPTGDRINAGFALAKTLDRRGDYDAAFEAYQATSNLIRAGDIAANRGFKLDELRGYVAKMRAQYTSTLFSAFQALGNPSELPVFIAGMPRSGTSLVEQIAASHPRVFGAGERKDVMEMVLRLNGDRGFVWPTQWDLGQFRTETEDHIRHLRVIGGDVDRVIDKLPDNIQLLGQIRIMFPNARIIICRRDLRDVCVSCFTTRFGDPIAWSNDLRECAQRAVEIERLTEHWRSVLPGPVLEVSYEAMVGNLEAESRRLIDFLGLDWDPACLEFHKTPRLVTTSSAWQVRQPLYDSSVGRWQRYRKHLGPMLEVLAGLVPEDPADVAESL